MNNVAEQHRSEKIPVLRAESISRSFGAGESVVHACREIDFAAYPSELLVIRGRSGSGKTTLLNLLGGLDRPDEGKIFLDNAELTAISEDQLLEIRRDKLGFVFQSFGLIPVLSAAENIEVPLRLHKMKREEREARVTELLAMVGLEKQGKQRPDELSGGQQQRVGLARALANNPKVIIADEPTGQLDSGTAAAMMDLMSELVHQQGAAAIVSTHDPLLISRADTVLEIHDGRAGHRGRHSA